MKRTLWKDRAILILLFPVIAAFSLWEALAEGWDEFWWSIKVDAREIRDAWRGE